MITENMLNTTLTTPDTSTTAKILLVSDLLTPNVLGIPIENFLFFALTIRS